MKLARGPRGALVRVARAGAAIGREVRTEVDRHRYGRSGGANLALFHEFAPAPAGGGHQFLRALLKELERRGLDVELNRISHSTPACLFNSFNFDFRRLRRFRRAGCRMVHRVDGPIGVYRGFDDGTDRRIAAINGELAAATIFQSRYSLEKHRELGLELVSPVVISNTVDPEIFRPPSGREPLVGRKARVIATSWSMNLRKGADTFAWLDRHLDPVRFEITFVGQTPLRFERIRYVPPMPSEQVAELLRAHDVFIAASLDDPCSNAVLEALACGLPVAYRRSGGHPELVGEAGIGFDEPGELLEALDRLVVEIEERRAAIRVPRLAEVADRYLEVLRV